MTQQRVRALWILLIWSVVAAGFLTTFFAAGGVETFAEDSMRFAAGAVFLAFGFVGTPVMAYLTRARAGSQHLAADERDERILLRASRGALITTGMYVFLACIALWDAYQEPGSVPVGWMWFLAYTTAIFLYLSTAIATLILDFGGFGDAEG